MPICQKLSYARITRSTMLCALLAALVAACAALPNVAHATGPYFHAHGAGTDTFSDVVCGIAVGGRTDSVFNIFADAEQNFAISDTFTTRLANPATGKSVVISMAGHGVGPAPVIDEQAGTVTFVSSYRGLYEKIQTAGGAVMLADAGILGYEQVFDLHTGELLSMRVVIDKGPHSDVDGARFCDVVTPALV